MPDEPRHNDFLSLGPHGFHRVAYTEWGNPDGRHIVVCVHGLTRNSRDFDELAAALAARGCRVVCMDVVGRGDSDWLEHKEDYGFAQYLADAAALLARLTAPAPRVSLLRRLQGASEGQRIDWIGTSMGGLIGMMIAAKPNSPIRRLVLNDVGPLVPWPALARLKLASRGVGMPFASVADVERHLHETCAPFGPLEDGQWRRLAEHGSRRGKNGAYALACDPAVVNAHRRGGNAGVEFGSDYLFGIDLWPVWDALECPTLVTRGAESDLLLESTARQMRERGPQVRLVEFAGIGHAPWLKSDDQIGVVRDFILEAEPPRPRS
jgi:pimeloyl-ACP methyl ester carboxylesterase